MRDLRAAFLEQALVASDNPDQRVLLAVTAPLITPSRLALEWQQFIGVLNPAVAHQLAFAAVTPKGSVTLPADSLTAAAAEFLGTVSGPQKPRARAFRWDRKRFDVFTALFDAWLEREEPLPIHELLGRAGVSYPTVSVTLKALTEREELTRTSSRSAGLAGVPRRSLEELVPRLTELRDSHFYVDASGRRTSPEGLLARLERKPLRGVQLGGVTAAREYWPGLNLNGLPRVDLTATWEAPPAFVHALDPALQRAPTAATGIILAVHHSRTSTQPLPPRAGKATVVFDLYSLGLSEQAEDFIRHARS